MSRTEVERGVTAGEWVLASCEVVATGVLFGLLSFASAPARVSVTAYPHVVELGGTVRLTCTVPRDPANRWLDYGVGEDTSSGRQLDGDQAPSVWTMYVRHVPCASAAWCIVRLNDGRSFRATTNLLVSGCEQ